ncbi:MAG: TraB/GumN family protein [Thermoplasmata archaeon]|nr:TraB/GumN family protein [Thermoplasmata archaeon]MCI4337936.1 TraB/GumN family protein [Thermoplasmata archaeon]MCI4341761.1 TraB/GumN family protein [Thermoplasmata archaeon]
MAAEVEGSVLVVGVAHVVDLGAPLRRLLGPRPLDGIAIELDADRYRALMAPTGTEDRRGPSPILLRLWAAMQQRLGDELGAGAGAEMKAAALIAMERQLPLLLVDDPIRDTLARLLRSLSVKERVTLLAGAVVGLFLPGSLVHDQLEAYRQQPSNYLEELRRVMPGVTRVLLDDRNEHMADRLLEGQRRGLRRLAVVVGDAHLPGLTQALQRRGVRVEQVPFSALGAATVP